MGRIFVVELEGRTYRCKYCKTHLSLADDIVSRAFHCRRGKAYLFSSVLHLWIEAIDIVTDIDSKYLWEIGKLCTQGYHLLDLHKVANWPQESVISETLHGQIITGLRVNITVGPHEERMMLSGMHTVADIFCCCCGQIVGWKYEAAHEKNQKYKEGKFVLERGRIIDGLETEFYIDTHPNMSDAEDV